MNNLSQYITEKLHLRKGNANAKMPFDDWVEYLYSIDMSCKEVAGKLKDRVIYSVYSNDNAEIGFSIYVEVKDKTKFYITGALLGKYHDKLDRENIFTKDWWTEGYNMKGEYYLCTKNNAIVMKDKIHSIINRIK